MGQRRNAGLTVDHHGEAIYHQAELIAPGGLVVPPQLNHLNLAGIFNYDCELGRLQVLLCPGEYIDVKFITGLNWPVWNQSDQIVLEGQLGVRPRDHPRRMLLERLH